MQVRFWGVRGSIPVPGPSTVVYGGNTSCVALTCGERLVVLDAGSGLRALGETLRSQSDAVAFDLLLTHCHIDHLLGLPFFAPAFSSKTAIRLWAGHLSPGERIDDIMGQLMIQPLLPITQSTFKANLTYRDFLAGDSLDLGGGITVGTAYLNHPGGATGYRIEYAGHAVCYLTDHEHVPTGPLPSLIELARDADVLIYDAMYTQAEYDSRIGWGHSTWEEAIRLADAAGARQLVLFHHDPMRDDAALDAIVNAAARARPGTIAAREGLVLDLLAQDRLAARDRHRR